MRFALLVAVFVCFTVFSVVVVADHGYTEFLSLAAREPWGLQMFLDIVIACSLFSLWMWKDARARGLPFLPYGLLILGFGSIGALAYLVHRTLKDRSAAVNA